ncbi:MAG TPA: PKD domain-containing protein, partial [Bacteroidia bacterium]|nr:PKD domain-containing protein [Bacteroidia bacterium]
TYTRPGNYTTCLTTTFSDSTSNGLCYGLSLGTPEAGCAGAFGSSSSGNTVYFSSSVLGTPPYSYAWDFGDGNTTSVSTGSVIHTYPNSGLYLVRLRVTDSLNHILDFASNCATQNYTGPITGFYNTGTSGTNANPMAFSNVIVSWTNASGTTFTSNNAAQPATSYFKIVSVDPYNTNQNGQSTRKIHALVKCTLYNGTGSITLDNADVVFAVAYH